MEWGEKNERKLEIFVEKCTVEKMTQDGTEGGQYGFPSGGYVALRDRGRWQEHQKGGILGCFGGGEKKDKNAKTSFAPQQQV